MEEWQKIEGSTLDHNSVISNRSTNTQPSAPPLLDILPLDYPEEGANIMNNNQVNNVVDEPEPGAYNAGIDPPIYENDEEYNRSKRSKHEKFFDTYGVLAYITSGLLICFLCEYDACWYMLSERCCCKWRP